MFIHLYEMPHFQNQPACRGCIHDLDRMANPPQAETAQREPLFPIEADGALELRNLEHLHHFLSG